MRDDENDDQRRVDDRSESNDQRVDAADKLATASVKAAEVLATAKLTAENRSESKTRRENVNLLNIHEAILVSAAATSELAEAIATTAKSSTELAEAFAATAQSSRRVQTWWMVCLTLGIVFMSVIVLVNSSAVRTIGDCTTPGGECYELLELDRQEVNRTPTGTTIPK